MITHNELQGHISLVLASGDCGGDDFNDVLNTAIKLGFAKDRDMFIKNLIENEADMALDILYEWSLSESRRIEVEAKAAVYDKIVNGCVFNFNQDTINKVKALYDARRAMEKK